MILSAHSSLHYGYVMYMYSTMGDCRDCRKNIRLRPVLLNLRDNLETSPGDTECTCDDATQIGVLEEASINLGIAILIPYFLLNMLKICDLMETKNSHVYY